MHIVIVGNSIAADSLLGELCELTPAFPLAVTVIGAEPHAAYNRVQLSQVLAGDVSASGISLREPDWAPPHRVRFMTGVRVDAIDRRQQRVCLNNGDTLSYDKLVLATGARARLPEAANAEMAGVHPFRTLDDAKTLIDTPKGAHTVVFGGGLLGLEAAAGLLARGSAVTLVHRNGWLLNRQLDAAAGRLLLANLQARGLRVELDSELSEIEGETSVTGVRLNTGRRLETTQVVFATGIAPRAELAAAASLEVNRGVVVDDRLCTADPTVFALGECAECAGETVGLVSPIYDHARVLAHALVDGDDIRYRRRDHATQLKVAGIDVFSAGDVNNDGEQVMVFDDPLTPARRKLILEQGRVKAIMLYGDVRDGPWFYQLLQRGIDTRALRDRLLFGKAYCEGIAA